MDRSRFHVWDWEENRVQTAIFTENSNRVLQGQKWAEWNTYYGISIKIFFGMTDIIGTEQKKYRAIMPNVRDRKQRNL